MMEGTGVLAESPTALVIKTGTEEICHIEESKPLITAVEYLKRCMEQMDEIQQMKINFHGTRSKQTDIKRISFLIKAAHNLLSIPFNFHMHKLLRSD